MAFLISRKGVFPDQYLTAFLGVMALAVLVLTAMLPLKIQAVGRAVAGACTASRAAEDLVHISDLLKLVRRQHHDFCHQLQTVYGLLEIGCYEEAGQYISKTHEAVSVPLELIRTGDPHVTALLYTKLALAESKQIRLEPVIACSLERLPLSPLEISALLGNLVDNALEAVEKAPPEHRVVRLEIKNDLQGCTITVGNYGRLDNTHPSRLFKAGYSTKKDHAGLGLASAMEIVVKHDGIIEVLANGSETVFRVSIPFTIEQRPAQERSQ